MKGETLSIRAIEWALTVKTGRATDKLVLLVLSDFTNDAGQCWPSLAILVERTELSQRAIQNAITRLKAQKLIEVIHRHRHSSVFKVHVVHPRVHVVHIRGAPRATRTVIDPLLNLRETERTKSAIETQIEESGERLGFRARKAGERLRDYQREMIHFDEHRPAVTVAYLRDEAAKRRTQ